MSLREFIQQLVNALSLGSIYALLALGLSVVYGIVERHGGKIEIQSEVGKGTRVAIRLPPRKAEP